jgi:hypothetical protein
LDDSVLLRVYKREILVVIGIQQGFIGKALSKGHGANC